METDPLPVIAPHPHPAGSCPGGAPENVEEDVGLLTASCPVCRAVFVYRTGERSWMREVEFEKMLQEAPPAMPKGM